MNGFFWRFKNIKVSKALKLLRLVKSLQMHVWIYHVQSWSYASSSTNIYEIFREESCVEKNASQMVLKTDLRSVGGIP